VQAAAQGTMNNFTFGNERYQYYETIAGGAGAGPGYHGASGVQTHMTNSRLTDPEVLEGRFPVLLREFALRGGSGGNGEFRGGDGLVREVEFRESMTAGILSNHRRIAPFGLAGGGPGRVGLNRLVRRDGASETLQATAEVAVDAGRSSPDRDARWRGVRAPRSAATTDGSGPRLRAVAIQRLRERALALRLVGWLAWLRGRAPSCVSRARARSNAPCARDCRCANASP
jgi:hypothetical protein